MVGMSSAANCMKNNNNNNDTQVDLKVYNWKWTYDYIDCQNHEAKSIIKGTCKELKQSEIQIKSLHILT